MQRHIIKAFKNKKEDRKARDEHMQLLCMLVFDAAGVLIEVQPSPAARTAEEGGKEESLQSP